MSCVAKTDITLRQVWGGGGIGIYHIKGLSLVWKRPWKYRSKFSFYYLIFKVKVLGLEHNTTDCHRDGTFDAYLDIKFQRDMPEYVNTVRGGGDRLLCTLIYDMGCLYHLLFSKYYIISWVFISWCFYPCFTSYMWCLYYIVTQYSPETNDYTNMLTPQIKGGKDAREEVKTAKNRAATPEFVEIRYRGGGA